MKCFFDTEFIEDGKTIDLISIGLVREDGDELYLISNEFDASKARDWVRENVLAKLPAEIDVKRYSRADIRDMILGFFCDVEKPEMWAYFADYDWVVFAQLFGRMVEMPSKFSYYCRDLKQVIDQVGIKPPEQKAGEHHALADARWVRDSHEYIAKRLASMQSHAGSAYRHPFTM